MLPLLAAAQWGLRAARAAQRLRREAARQARAYRRAAPHPPPPLHPLPRPPEGICTSHAWHAVRVPCTASALCTASTSLGPQGEKARRIKMTNELLVPVLRRR